MKQMRSRGLSLVMAGVMGLSLSLPAWSAPEQVAQSRQIETYRLAQQVQTRTIAVVDFENHTGDSGYDNFKRGLAESLMTKLARRPEFVMVERGQLDKALKELGFGQSVYADPNNAKQVGKMLNADYIIAGDVVKAGNRFEINTRMIEVETGKVLVTESYGFASANDTLPVVDYLALLIPRKLNLYVSDTELDMARSRLNGNQTANAQGGDNSWIWWTIGGVVVVGAAIAVAVVVSRPKQDIIQCVGPNCGTNTSGNNFNPQLPMLRF